jgi:hypothetical protein
VKKVKFKNGYVAEMQDKVADIYLKKGRVELVGKAEPAKKPEPKKAEK